LLVLPEITVSLTQGANTTGKQGLTGIQGIHIWLGKLNFSTSNRLQLSQDVVGLGLGQAIMGVITGEGLIKICQGNPGKILTGTVLGGQGVAEGIPLFRIVVKSGVASEGEDIEQHPAKRLGV
jgi:hypothetical protein